MRFTGVITTPPRAGSIIAAQWDFYGKGDFRDASPAPGHPRQLKVVIALRLDQPRVWFPALRGVSQRDGDRTTPYARIQTSGASGWW